MILVVGFKILDRVSGKGCGICAKAVDKFLRAQKADFVRSFSLAPNSAVKRPRLRAWQRESARFEPFRVFLSYCFADERNLRKC